MRIGIFPIPSPDIGGIYQYSLTMIEALAALQKEGLPYDFSLLYSSRKVPPIPSAALAWPLIPLRQARPFARRVKRILRSMTIGSHTAQFNGAPSAAVSVSDPYSPRFNRPMAERLTELGIELLILPAPSVLSFESGLPYVFAMHDLQHRLQPQFPEVSANGEWDKREYLFRNAARFATLLIADSETGKEDILNCYAAFGVSPDRVKVLPYLPAIQRSPVTSDGDRQRVRDKYHLAERYLFYPAQFWPHKNHIRIVKALGLLRDNHQAEIHVVFCGSHTLQIREETFQQTMQIARELSVDRQVHYLGYVDEQDMPSLYAEARGLVMPTFFGPTNIPVLEAWEFGCPVLTSDIRGIREQVGNAGLLVDPRSVESLAEGMYRLWQDDSLRAKLAELGKHRLQAYSRDDYRKQLSAIIEEAVERVREKISPARGRSTSLTGR
jgi:glycosyltransferase involved in cell wall biosynthesis